MLFRDEIEFKMRKIGDWIEMKYVKWYNINRGSGRYEKLVVLLFKDRTKNVGGEGCLLSEFL